MKALTAEEYDKQYQEHLKQGGEELFNYDGFDYIVKCEDRFAKEYNSFVELRRGLQLVSNIIDRFKKSLDYLELLNLRTITVLLKFRI